MSLRTYNYSVYMARRRLVVKRIDLLMPHAAARHRKAAIRWRLGVRLCGLAQGPVRRLDGEGVFEFLHPRLQILGLALLFFQEEVFDAVQL